MELKEGKLYYNKASEDLMESWNYVLEIEGDGVWWRLFIIDTRGTTEHLRTADEYLSPLAYAAEGLKESTSQDKKKLINYIFKLPIADDLGSDF